MAPPKHPISSAAAPKYGNHFDAWNSSTSGHQTAESRKTTGWRLSRSMKLSSQLKGGSTGGKRLSDLVGAGSEHWDERAKALVPKDERTQAKITILDILVSKRPLLTSQKNVSENPVGPTPDTTGEETADVSSVPTRGIFEGLTIYINGSTTPLISDHRLKYVLAEHGAKIALHLGRRQVTHVILGNPCGRPGTLGAGGGLAATKIQKEIRRTGGCGVRYVSVEWVLGCVKAGIRLPESRFSNLAVAPKGQRSAYGNLLKSEDNFSGAFSGLSGGV